MISRDRNDSLITITTILILILIVVAVTYVTVAEFLNENYLCVVDVYDQQNVFIERNEYCSKNYCKHGSVGEIRYELIKMKFLKDGCNKQRDTGVKSKHGKNIHRD